MATTKTDAEKAAKLRQMAKDKSLPQAVRNQYLDDANMLEQKAAKAAGVRLAKGGAVAKASAKKAAGKPIIAIMVGVGKPTKAKAKK